MPDIEKRLEAFVRIAHGIIVFPGGVGTLEEILFLLGTLMDPRNADIHLPVVFAAPSCSQGYFQRIDRFLVQTLGEHVRNYYKIVEDDPVGVAKMMKKGMGRVSESRRKTRDAYYYSWLLHIPEHMKSPFNVNHKNMAALELSKNLPASELVVNLRRAFSGIVAGNVKEKGVRLVREHGPFVLRGDQAMMSAMDGLLRDFVEAGRMKLIRESYNPCYTIEPVQ
jgi:hypothetical protein